MGEQDLDLEGFYRWAMGDLVDNRNRGIFAEWLVGQALGAISDGEVRHEWDAYDLLFGEKTVEVKASGVSQTWDQEQESNIQDRPSAPRFDIAPRKWSWVAETNQYIEHDPPKRFADVYVFCLHEPKKVNNENVQDPACWTFWVISKQTLDDKLGDQKSVGIGTLNEMADHVGWSGIRAEVDHLKLV